MISIEDAEQALNYLKSTDKEAARAKALSGHLDDAKKTVLAMEFQKSEGKSGAEKLKDAESSELYLAHLRKLQDAVYDYELIRNRRKTAEFQIEMWRSVNSNQRKGNI